MKLFYFIIELIAALLFFGWVGGMWLFINGNTIGSVNVEGYL